MLKSATYRVFQFVLAAVMLLCPQLYAQQAPEILVNKSVLDIRKVGFGNQPIISNIKVSASKFNLSPAALIMPKKANVDEDIIQEMVDKSSSKPAAMPSKVGGRPTKASTLATVPASVANLELLNHIDTFYDDKVVPLEKLHAYTKLKLKTLGVGYVLDVQDDTSTLQLGFENTSFFVTKTGNDMLL